VATLPELISRDGLFVDGDWIETKDQDPAGEVRLTQLADVGDGHFRNRSTRFLRRDQADGLNCTYLQRGDVLVARMPDPLGRACIVPDLGQPAVTAVDVCIVRPGSTSVDPRWLMWTINSPLFRSRVAELQTGTTRKRISRKNLASIPLRVPPLAEQRRIVAATEEQFSRLDAAERVLADVRVRLARLPAIVLGYSFARFVDHVPLDDVAEVRLGRQRSPKNHKGPNMTPYLRAANVTWAGLDLSDVKSMHFTPSEVVTYQLRPGDVLLSEASGSAGEVGKPAIWRGELATCCFQNTLIRVRTRAPLPEFLRLVFLHAALVGKFARAAPGVGIHHLGASRLAEWPIPVATEQEQRELIAEIEQQLSLIDNLRAAVEAAQKRSAALRRAILERAFRGELVPQDPDDEPASVLLERIRAERAAASKPTRRRATMKAS
jgi:type I restriction enzyme S subunit